MVIMSDLSALRELMASLQNYGAEAQPKDAKAKTRARILRTATELFQQRGYRHVSVDDVARESGVAKGTVYVHFKNKAELLFHAIAEEKKQFVGQFLPLLNEKLAPKKRLRRYVELSLLAVLRAPLISKLMSGDREMLLFLEELGPELTEQVRSNQMLGMSALLEGVGSFDRLEEAEKAERIAALQGLLYAAGQLMDERVRGGLSTERYAAQLAKMIVDGIGAP
jgi:AcrR family transcriptional regulator